MPMPWQLYTRKLPGAHHNLEPCSSTRGESVVSTRIVDIELVNRIRDLNGSRGNSSIVQRARREVAKIYASFERRKKVVVLTAETGLRALPLIRRFNEHSERLLKSALGDVPATKRRRLDADSESAMYTSIDLDDLHDPDTSPMIALEMKDRQRYFEGRAESDAINGSQNTVNYKVAVQGIKENLQEWTQHLGSIKLDKKAADTALETMTRNVSARLDVKKKPSDIPEALLRQMTTCETAGNEFLRQFWAAIYPPASDLQTLATASPVHKAAKADRMADYLSKTPAKVDALVNLARQDGVDSVKVLVALQPLLDAVEKALLFYRTRRPSR